MKKTIPFALSALFLSQFPFDLQASERRFTYVYEATTAAKGEIEVETWTTWKTTREESGRSNRFDFRHEIEYGVTDQTSLALYVADWKIVNGQTFYQDTAVEVIQNLTNPVTDLVGSALYAEAKLGDQLFKLEGKVLLQKLRAHRAGLQCGPRSGVGRCLVGSVYRG